MTTMEEIITRSRFVQEQQGIRELKDIMRVAHHQATESLENKTERLVDLLTEKKEWLTNFKPKIKDHLPEFTEQQLEERIENYEYTVDFNIKDTKELIEYNKDLIRYFVSFRQQNLKNVLKYHKLCRDFEYSRMEMICDGKVDRFTLDATRSTPEEVIEGPSEIARIGTKVLQDTYMDRQKTIGNVLRWEVYFK
jgi:flagellar biosynthesis/type III secretory pathway chaperone